MLLTVPLEDILQSFQLEKISIESIIAHKEKFVGYRLGRYLGGEDSLVTIDEICPSLA